MAITALPTPPTRSDPATFATRGDVFMTALPAFATEANALLADVNAKEAAATTAANIMQSLAGVGAENQSSNLVHLTFALNYALDQAAMANKRVSDATSFQTQTGTASFTQSASTDIVRTYATATVTLPKAFKNTDYQVVIDPVTATPALGWQGEITVQSRSVNSFVLQMSGSATACSVRWKTLHPNAENRVHVVLPTAQ
jgi:hypothetical protein